MEGSHATLMVRHGGKILRSSDGGRLTYDGGQTQLVKVRRSSSLRELHYRLAAVAGCFTVALKYVSPDDSDALRDVVTDDDVQRLLRWALYRDLQILLGVDSEVVVPRVKVMVVSMDVRSPLPESLFSVDPTSPIAAPCPSPAPPAMAPVSPSPLPKRSASAPSLSPCSANDTSEPPSPSLIQRSASTSRLTCPSTNPITTTTSAATMQEGILHYGPAAPFPAMQSGHALVYPAPVFLVPVYPTTLQKRSESAPSLSVCSVANDTSEPPSPSLIQRSASASRLTLPSTDPITITTAGAASTRATQEDNLHYAVPFPPMQSGHAPVYLAPVMQIGPALVYPDPVFLVPGASVVVYQPVIPLYPGFLVPAGCRGVVVTCAA